MDIDISSLVLVSLLVFFMSLYIFATQTKRKSNNLPPGPKKLPLIGNLHLFASSVAPHRVLADLALKYGPLVHLRLGEVSTLVVSSAEVAEEVMKKHDLNFANRPSLFLVEMFYKDADIAFAPYGEYWRQLRKICTLELLSKRRVQSFRPSREKEILDMCRRIAQKEGSVINLSERIESTLFSALVKASVGKIANKEGILVSTIKESVDLVSGFSVVDMYPSIKLLRLISGMKRKVKPMHAKIDAILQEIIDDHKVAIGESKLREDFVDVLLKFNDAGSDLYLTIDNIKAVLFDMFAGGIETSSVTIDWAMAEMLRHPRVLQKAQDEVRRVFANNGFVEGSEFDKLKYLKFVVKEILRLHPPSPLLLPRQNSEECEINGYKVATKTKVLVNAWAIGRDPKMWKDADSFIPERYLDLHEIDYKGNNFEYIPFGAGRRICPGSLFGLAYVEHALAALLLYFDWVSPENVDMAESFGATARRKYPLRVIPIVRNPLPM
ncbi:salviol synthase-like [Andrographis paniculata]|uniref:salviol synthase-like n=1 Tax=Andrographis paniculata TaxID=175694 RepID=UPI0021E82D27|nr:salviol synthase-like [Andrographis paniculata]